MRIKILRSTIAKQSTQMASMLGVEYKTELKAGDYNVLKAEFVGNKHFKITFPTPVSSQSKTRSFKTWCVWMEDIEVEISVQSFKARPQEVSLGMAYLSQRNNDFNPDGACNVTSIAMCLKYLGINRKTSVGQFEDELYDYCESKGLSRHDPYDLQRLAEAYGAQDEFRESATLNQIKSHLAIGNPVVIHGYFTDFGHIVAVNGYNDDGLYVHDPYGEWFLSGYKLNNPYGGEGGPGENIFYSNELITQTCDHDGIWAHFLAK